MGPIYELLTSALLSSVAAVYINHLLKNRIAFKKYLGLAVVHVSLSNSYTDKGKTEESTEEMKIAARYFLEAGTYTKGFERNLCETFAHMLLNGSTKENRKRRRDNIQKIQ